jgi:hypothetical protein
VSSCLHKWSAFELTPRRNPEPGRP